MQITDEMLRLVEAAYACALDGTNLPRFLEMLSASLNARCAQLVTLGSDGACLHATGGVDKQTARRLEHAWTLAYAGGYADRLLPDLAAFSLRDFPEAFPGMRSLPAQLGLENWEDAVGAVIGRHAATTTMVVCLPRSNAAEDASAIRAMLQVLLPYFSRAFLLMQSSNEGLLTLSAAGELTKKLPMPCLITDAAGRCIEPNDAFLNLMPVLSMRIVAGRVRFDNPYLHEAWQTALSEAWHTAETHSRSICPGPGKQWRLHLLPIRCLTVDSVPTEIAVLLAIFEEKTVVQLGQGEARGYAGKLTGAELEVLSGLLQGQGAKAIARSRGASVHTVRSQIMAILTKTGHHSQKELMAAFGASAISGPFDSGPFDPDK